MTPMNTLRLPDRTDMRADFSVIWFAAIFGLVTYAAISARAMLSPFEVNYLIDAKRGVSVVLGAFVLWLAIRVAERNSGGSLGAQIFAILNVAIPGAIALLLAREAYDLATSGEFAQRLALNVRWMLTWTGYFAAAVAGFLALGYYRELQLVRAHNTGLNDNALQTAPRAKAEYESAEIDFDPRRQA
jgi:hypothetical protein